MDPITFTCPACLKPLTVPREAAGAEGPCPTCGTLIRGPGESGTPEIVEMNGASQSGAEEVPLPEKPQPEPEPTPISETSAPIPEPTPVPEETASLKEAAPSATVVTDVAVLDPPAPDPVTAPEKAAAPTEDAVADEAQPVLTETASAESPAMAGAESAEPPLKKKRKKIRKRRSSQSKSQETPPPDAATKAASKPSRRGLGLFNHAALHLLGILAAFVVGYQIGQRSNARQPSEDIPLVNLDMEGAVEEENIPVEPKPEEAGPEEAAPPEPEAVAVASTEEPAPAEVSPARVSLEAFLSAPAWPSRQVHVLYPEKVLADMEATAKQEGDGAIAFQSISKLPTRNEELEQIFEVVTENHPNGFPVSLTNVEDQWLVDWEGFAECYYEALVTHSKAKTGATDAFRVLLRPDESGAADFILSPPTLADSFPSRIEKGSAADQRISSIIKYYTSTFPEEYARSVEAGGIPLILELTTADPASGCNFLITDFVSTSWSPPRPDKR